MSSVEVVEEEFQKAVDRALCRVSREPFDEMKAEGADSAMRRINRVMSQLEELRGSKQPDYRDPDVALFYSQWYLPEQINVTYSESVCVFWAGRDRANAVWTKKLQLVDFGAGTGAMAIGLTLAIATHVRREDWPKRLSAYQIDHPAMLEFGHAIWRAILEEAGDAPALGDFADVMERAQLRVLPLDDELNYDAPPRCEDAERWLTAIHVAYKDDMPKIKSQLWRLLRQLKPHLAMRTVSESKKHHMDLKRPRAVGLRLCGEAQEITSLRKELGDRTNARHPFLYTPVRWGDGEDGGGKRHYAATAC